MEKATFAAGCFWGVQVKFARLDGVISTQVGFTGGHKENPTYEEVCSDETGHAEAVEVTFDPEKISYEQLLDVFWSIGKGVDVGSQYRSAIFYHSEEQKKLAEKSKPPLAVTKIVPASTFWRAEEYHQEYYKKTGRCGC
ncbi:MAG: peptide-methionine (S)-S-oxide reductase [Candidatus Melainabacteria bacterium GWF2_37_15]|nr:MAG: peptide-methionine (S)-S-oxide reductase [Candidatus Melainabacteria bacterium GWF2_37_15]